MIISSQTYRDQDIVDQKISDRDFMVTVSPEFCYDGDTYQVVIDGHHSLEAAKQTGAPPVWHVATQQESDAVALLEDGLIEEYLDVAYSDDDYYDVETGYLVWG